LSEPSSSKQPRKSNHSRRGVIPATVVKGSSGCGCGKRKKPMNSSNQGQTKPPVDSTVDKVGEETKSLIEQNNKDVTIKQSESEEKPIISSNSPHNNETKTKSFMDKIKEKFPNHFPKF
jgi:hypothetical protein